MVSLGALQLSQTHKPTGAQVTLCIPFLPPNYFPEMASLLKSLRKVIRRPPELPLRFPAAGFEVFRDSVIVEEEQFDDFKTGQYYPVKIGDVYDGKYQVLGKLGFGTTSTVWLARNLKYVLGKSSPKFPTLYLPNSENASM